MKKSKSSSIAKRLITAFLSMALLVAVVGGAGIFSIKWFSNLGQQMYEEKTAPIEHLIRATKSLYQIRVDVRAAIIDADDPSKVEAYQESYQTQKEIFLAESALYREHLSGDEASLALFDEAAKLFTDSSDPVFQKTYEIARDGDPKGAYAVLVTATADVQELFADYDTLVEQQMAAAEASNEANGRMANLLIYGLIALVAVGTALAILLARSVSSRISKPISRVAEAADKIALGHVDIDLNDIKTKDETGMLAASFRQMLEGIRKQVQVAKLISEGDFTQAIPLRSGEDVLGLALQKIETDLSNTLLIINNAADQVNSGAGQVASASQALASGTAEQAATMEELNASIASVAQQAEQNATNVGKAISYVEQSSRGAMESNTYMKQLNTAMMEIGESSQQISRITKLVEDIAFQTNILALNAAVEAARAGNAGKGFAVVADEVRNLAAKSAEAAKQTAELIEKSGTSVAEGQRLASETLKLLELVIERSQLVDQAIREIDVASTAQASAVQQINQGLAQVSAVVQTNAATAEESSASSEELAAQAEALQTEVIKFKLKDSQGHIHESRKTTRAQGPGLEIDIESVQQDMGLAGDFGKYEIMAVKA